MIIIQLAGRVGKDPEARFIASGQKVTTFSLATNIRKGGKEDVTVWWRITVWGERFDKLLAHIKKGSALVVVGEMSRPPEMYTDRDGKQQVSSLELTAEMIKFSPFGNPDRPAQDQTAGQSQSSAPAAYQPQGSYANTAAFGDFAAESSGDDTMPF